MMALVRCTECGNEVSSLAFNCPYCGYPITRGVWAGLPAELLVAAAGAGFLWLLDVGPLIVLLLAGLAGLLALILVVVRVRSNGWSVFVALGYVLLLGLVGFGLGYGLAWVLQNGLPFSLPARMTP